MNQYNALRTTMTTSLQQPPATSSQIHIISWNKCSNTTYVTVRHANECFEYHISLRKCFPQGQNTRNANPLRELLSTMPLYMMHSKITKCWLHEYRPTTLLIANVTTKICSFSYCTSYQSSGIWKVTVRSYYGHNCQFSHCEMRQQQLRHLSRRVVYK